MANLHYCGRSLKNNAKLLSKEPGTKLTGRYIEYLNINKEFNYSKKMLFKTEERAKPVWKWILEEINF